MKTAFAAALLIYCLPLEAKVLHVGERPESACRGFDGKLYVTVMNSPDTPGDGVIKVIDGDEVRVFATGLDEPKGICFTGEHLIATDLTRVWKIDASGQATVLAAADAFPHPTRFLNDVTLASDERSVLVADTGGNAEMFSANGLWPVESPEAEAIPQISRIYRITLEGEVSIMIDAQPTMLNANGVTAPEPGLILVAEFFRGGVLAHRDGRFGVLATGLRGADGIVRDETTGHIYVSSWTQGKVWRLEPDGANPTVIVEGLRSAADLYLDAKRRVLVVPDMLAGTLLFLPL